MNDYAAKKRFYSRLLTIYGRKPVLEALSDADVTPFRLHLARSNKPAGIVRDIEQLAQAKSVEVQFHDRQSLARISKNGKQDQGVALDIECRGFVHAEEFFAALPERFELMALDGVTNPQNLGMIVRSVCASPLYGLLLPERGCARLDALVIKASAGTLFRAKIILCPDLAETLAQLRQQGSDVYALAADGGQSLQRLRPGDRSVYVVGNETSGLSPACRAHCNDSLAIPMANGVESLNVGVAASLIAFRGLFPTALP